MQIDWFTFVAQLINFGILLWLLNRFLFGPITAAIADREATIAARIQSADDHFAEAVRMESDWQVRQNQIHEEAESLRAKARESVEQHRLELLGKARQNVEKQRSDWLAAQDRERQSSLREIRSETVSTALAVARGALSELAGRDLDSLVIGTLASRIRHLSESEQLSIRESLGGDAPVVITTALEPEPADVVSIRAAIAETVGFVREPVCEVSGELIAGVRVRLGSHELSWSIEDYLDSVTERFEGADV